MEQNLYQVLGVAEDADAQTIKNAFRKLAKKYHPDVNGGNAEAEKRFKEVNEAYGILSDEAKKKEYDANLHKSPFGDKAGANAKNAAGSKTKAKTTRRTSTNPFDFNMNFEDFFGEGMEYDGKAASSKKEPDFMNVNQQFANFFGFKPK